MVSNDNPPAPGRRYYYGWNLVALSLLTSLFSVGIVFYTHGVFRLSLIEDFGFSVEETYDVYALHIAAVAVYSFFLTPWLIEKWGTRRTVLLGCVVLTVALLLLSVAPNKAVFFFVFAVLVSLGANCMGLIASRAVIANWFDRRRAQAMSFAAMGITAGGIVNVPLATWLIHEWGWRAAYAVFAGLVFVIGGPIVALFWKDHPSEVGLVGEPNLDGTAAVPALVTEPLVRTKQLLSSGLFLRLALSMGTASAGWSIVIQSLIADFVEQGYSSAQATVFFTVITWIILIGKPLYGPVGDKIDRKWAIFNTLAMQFAAIALLLYSRFERPLSFEVAGQPFDLALLGGFVLMGIGIGGCQPLYSAYLADLLGRRSFVRASGVMVPIVLGCQLVGYKLNGALVDATGTYLWMWFAMGGFYVVSAVLLSGVPTSSEIGPERHPIWGEAEVAPSAFDAELIEQTGAYRRYRSEATGDASEEEDAESASR